MISIFDFEGTPRFFHHVDENPQPEIEVQLAHDSGASATDHLTDDPSISGNVQNDANVVMLRLVIDSASPRHFQDITSYRRDDADH